MEIRKFILSFVILIMVCGLFAEYYPTITNSVVVGEPVKKVKNADLKEISGILIKISTSLDEVPADINRVAVYRIRVDRYKFAPGIAEYIRGKIEDILSKSNRFDMVVVPELKLTKVIVTDSSFKFTNSVRSNEELWGIARENNIDAFIEGDCSKSAEGSILINLKMVRANSGAIVWSRSLPEVRERLIAPEFLINYDFSLGYYPVDSYRQNPYIYSGDVSVYEYSLSVAREQKLLLKEDRISMDIKAGISLFSVVVSPDDAETGSNSSFTNDPVVAFSAGTNFYVNFFRKKATKNEYWLKSFAGVRVYKALSYSGNLITITAGGLTPITRNISMGLGLNIIPSGSYFDSSNRTIDLQEFSGELKFVYTF